MTLSFPIKRMIFGDSFLQSFATPQETVISELAGKSIAIVGNARSLADQEHGTKINNCDVVIRMHTAPLIARKSHGSKTTWLALGMPVDQSIINAHAPDRLLWMAKKRKRVRYSIAMAKGFYIHPKDDWDIIAQKLSAPPTTGVMLIDLAKRSNAAQINLFGFDFFASLSLSGRRTAAQVPHNFAAEKQFVTDLMERDLRVVLHS
jgi:hypothetical protein